MKHLLTFIIFMFSSSIAAQTDMLSFMKATNQNLASFPYGQEEHSEVNACINETKSSIEGIQKSIAPSTAQQISYPKTIKDIMNMISGGSHLYFIADVFGGYSNFSSGLITPKAGFGFGADVGVQCDYNMFWSVIPQGLFGELTIGYALRGSGAYPIHYLNCRALPFAYRYDLTTSINLIAKGGMYFGLPLSDVSTRKSSYGTNFDYGISLGIGAEYNDFGFLLSYEFGFEKAIDSYRANLCNNCFFMTFTYRILTLK